MRDECCCLYLIWLSRFVCHAISLRWRDQNSLDIACDLWACHSILAPGSLFFPSRGLYVSLSPSTGQWKKRSPEHASNTSIKSFSFLCWTLRIVGQKVSTKNLMAALSDCLPSSSCLLLHEYWNFVPNNNNIPVKETKIWLSFKTWCSLSVPQCTASNERNWNSWCLYCETVGCNFSPQVYYSKRDFFFVHFLSIINFKEPRVYYSSNKMDGLSG